MSGRERDEDDSEGEGEWWGLRGGDGDGGDRRVRSRVSATKKRECEG